GQQPAAVAEGVRMLERALDDIREPLDVGVRMHRPVGARNQPVVVEDAQRPDAHLTRVSVPVEREMPAGREPAAFLRVDLSVASDLQHRHILTWSAGTVGYRVSTNRVAVAFQLATMRAPGA